jgi:hypothetical protein
VQGPKGNAQRERTHFISIPTRAVTLRAEERRPRLAFLDQKVGDRLRDLERALSRSSGLAGNTELTVGVLSDPVLIADVSVYVPALEVARIDGVPVVDLMLWSSARWWCALVKESTPGRRRGGEAGLAG